MAQAYQPGFIGPKLPGGYTSYAKPALKPTSFSPDYNNKGQVQGAYTGGGGGQPQPQQPQQSGGANYDEIRQREESAAQRALQAALGVYDSRKQGLLGQIPGLDEELGLTLKGYDQGLESFNQTAEREQGSRVAGLEENLGGIENEYTRANRTQRKSAQSLSRQLRNMFGSLGTLDSTQYKDMNIEQSREIAQSVGDLQREKAGKITSNQREQEDIKKYYSEQKLQEQKRVTMQKEKEVNNTNRLKQQIMADVNLTDAQKIEAVEGANQRLEQRMSELNIQEANLKETRRKEDQDLQLKLAQLGSKDYSTDYKAVQENKKSIEQANAVVQGMVEQYGTLSPQQITGIFTQFGVSPEDAELYGQIYSSQGSAKSGGGSFDTFIGG